MARKRNTQGQAEPNGELRSSPDVVSGLIPGNTFGAKAVRYAVVDGLALFEGDIVLGTAEQAEQRTQELRDQLSGFTPAAVVISGAQFRWPGCQVPYQIDPALTNQQRVTDAIAHWEQNTRFRFVLRTGANAATFPDFVTFRPSGGCSSSVGRQGGEQFVNLGPGCTTGNAIHEIGHVVGLWHEQSREDRDSFVTIHLDKVQPGFEHNFDQHITDGDDVGAYDYGSIMHYPRNAFSVDGSDTITPIDPNAQIGQRTALSPGDIAAANSFCPITKPVFKDGPKDPIIDKPPRVDTIKERIRDTIKELIKDPIRDVPRKPIFDLPGKGIFEQPFPGPITGLPGPGRLASGEGVPFAVAAPHQAPAAGGGQAPGQLDQTIAELDAHLQELAAHLAQIEGNRDALQAQYDQLAAALEQLLAQQEQSGQ
jgi:Astacin (Peptidase family M12A)